MEKFFTEQKLEKRLQELSTYIHRGVQDIPSFRYIEDDPEGAHQPDYDDSKWANFQVGNYWGGYDKIAWFRTTVSLPKEWLDKKLALRFLTGPRDGGGSTAEALLYVNGKPLQGIDIWHEEAWLPPELKVKTIDIALRVWSGVLNVPPRRHFKLAQLVWIDEDTEAYFFMADTILKSVQILDKSDLRRSRLLQVLNDSYNLINFLQPKSDQFYASITRARQFLQQGLPELTQAEEMKPTVTCVGHSHIDMAWLWRLSHTREKTSRTFSTVLNLMRQYPEYRFMHSSPQLYKFLKSDYPQIYVDVKRRIESGEWEITGGMWVEPDTNIPSGESLIRQILFGKRFIKEEFGQDSAVVWLPDVFGYSWALPQIIKGCGMKCFMTTKISWSQYNRFPYDTFVWRGIDGSEVLTHFITTPSDDRLSYTYNGVLEPQSVKGTWDVYQQKEYNDDVLLSYGWGDGGGGPTKEMLEAAKYLKNMPGIPKVHLGKVEPFFTKLAKTVQGKEPHKQLPLWDGELYLEYHRGTYTSQAFIKRANRMAEILYHDAELWASAADAILGTTNYPSELLTKGWERILLNQFHDILPGSSIRQVYEDSRSDYAKIAEIGNQVLDQALERLTEEIVVPQNSIVVFNSLGWERSGIIELPLETGINQTTTVLNLDGQPLANQLIEIDGEQRLLVEVGPIPSLGYRAFTLTEGVHEEPSEITVTPQFLENRFFKIELNESGQLTSIYDKQADRQVLSPNARGNVLQAFEDKPLNFDAWDIDIYYQEKMTEIGNLVEAVVEEEGPIRGVLRLVWSFGNSRITQRLAIYKEILRIDFMTEVDWQESQVLLKTAFPVDIRSTKAAYEIQFGHIERPTHWNTSWDWARFEAVGHKWVDLSEGNYGVSLLNDCKYGHDIKDGVLRLTLLKSATSPDETADRGRHEFTYSLYPHQGSLTEGATIEEAYQLNLPLRAVYKSATMGSHGTTSTLNSEFSLASVDQDNVIIETVKKAEHDGAVVFRVYDSKQCRSKQVELRFGRPVIKAAACNLVEEDIKPLEVNDNAIRFSLAPFQVRTFKIWFR